METTNFSPIRPWNDDDRDTKDYITYEHFELKPRNLYKDILNEMDLTKWNYFDDIEYCDYVYEEPSWHDLDTESIHSNDGFEDYYANGDDDDENDDEVDDIVYLIQQNKFIYT